MVVNVEQHFQKLVEFTRMLRYGAVSQLKDSEQN